MIIYVYIYIYIYIYTTIRIRSIIYIYTYIYIYTLLSQTTRNLDGSFLFDSAECLHFLFFAGFQVCFGLFPGGPEFPVWVLKFLEPQNLMVNYQFPI